MKKVMILFFLLVIQQTVYSQKEQYDFFMKTWNFLKYYHPDLASEKIDSDSLFLVNIEKVNDQSDANSIIKLLSGNLKNQFSGAPVVDNPKDILSANQDFKWYQKDKKISTQNRDVLSNIYQHRFVTEGIKKEKANKEETKDQFSKNDNLPLAYRLLTFAKIQGSIDYLYPNKYLMDKNSDIFFKSLLNETIHCSSRKDFEIILAKAVSKMEDTHSFKFYEQLNDKNEIFNRLYFPPFDYIIFDDHLLITHLILPELCSKSNIKIGDKITEIDGKKIRSIIKEKKELLSASNHETLLYMISDYQRNLIWPNNNQQKELKIQSGENNTTYQTKVDYINFTNKQHLEIVSKYIKEKIHTKDQYKMVHDDLAYFKINDVFSLSENIPEDKLDDHMDNIMKDASSKKAIVFDMRGYPDWGGFVFYYVYKYFSPVHNYFGKYYKPNVKNIGTYIPISYSDFGVYYHDIKNKTTHPYSGKVFLIVNPETLSMSEWNTMNLQNIFPQAITIGQQTAGADGDIVSVKLPAGYDLIFSGNTVFYYDHTQTQKVGVKINENIKYSDEDILQNRDLEFERVLKALR